MRPSASERRGERVSAENLWPDYSLHKPRIERDIARNKKRIIRWGMMRQIQKNGRPSRTEPARLFLRGELAHPSFFSVVFLRYETLSTQTFSAQTENKTAFFEHKCSEDEVFIYRFMSETPKTVPIPAPSTRNRHWLQVDYYSSSPS